MPRRRRVVGGIFWPICDLLHEPALSASTLALSHRAGAVGIRSHLLDLPGFPQFLAVTTGPSSARLRYSNR